MAIKKILLLTIVVLLFLVSCSKGSIEDGPLKEFIYYASENGLPVGYLKMINSGISLRYRARPAYSSKVIYLTESFNDDGVFLPFYKLDSFEISSVFHEGFHAYVDLIIKKGNGPVDERISFYGLMEDSLDSYTMTADGRKIQWKNYRMQASEEAMAIQITNLIKYRIVYEKMSEKTARNYIYGLIDELQMEDEILLINELWKEVIDGKRSRGYYNKSFLRWKFPHIIDAKNYISESENDFVKEYILPGICTIIQKPPLTDFIKSCKTDGLPCDYLIDINKNHFWDEDMVLESYKNMSPGRISQIYILAFDIYWEMILKRDLGSSIDEREAFNRMLDTARKWYSGPEVNTGVIDQIIKNAAAEYIKNIIFERAKWQDALDEYLIYGGEFNSKEFEKSWKDAIEGKDIYGYYLDEGIVIKTSEGMTISEKKFILEFILPAIDLLSGSPVNAEPVPAGGEIDAEAGVFSDLKNAGN